MKQYTKEQINSYIKHAEKYLICEDWAAHFGFLEPKEIAWDKMQEVKNSHLYLLCKCHCPGCTTNHLIPIRTDLLNGDKQISCRACALKGARKLLNLPQKNWGVGDIVCETQLLVRALTGKEKKELLGLKNSHCKYWEAHCIKCNRVNYIHNDNILHNDAHCICNRMSVNERKIYDILEQLQKENLINNFIYQDKCGKTRLKADFIIYDKDIPILGIEYDGEFHDSVEFYPNSINTQIERDIRKNQFFEENNIPLLRIHHVDQNLINREWLIVQMKKYITL